MALPTEQLKDVAWALDALVPRQDAYQKARAYYGGDHQRMIDQQRLQTIFKRLFDNFRLNLCKPVVDSLTDRLEVASFSGGEAEDQDALDIWKRNRMRRRSGYVHLEAVVTGDSYVIVWPDSNDRATLYPQKAHEVAVRYSPEEPGKILKAAKLWRSDERTARLTLYHPERIERFVASTTPGPNLAKEEAEEIRSETDETTGTHPTAVGEGWLRPEAFTWVDEDPETPNPYGVVPVFHFANNADIGGFGTSELHDAVPVQDMLNYLAFNILVASEFQAFRQRWATGIEIPKNPDGSVNKNAFKAGPERMWIAGSKDGKEARFGEFSAADLGQLDSVKRSAALDMAQVTQTPPHYFMSAANLVSGESQKTAEQKLDAKVSERQEAFGDTWAAAVALAVRMDRGLAADGLELDVNWADKKPRMEKEEWEIAELKKELGVSPQQILRERGYTDEQIQRFAEETAEMPGRPASAIDRVLNNFSTTPPAQ